MAVVTVLGNCLVLWGRFTQRDENHAVSLVIRNLAVSDMLMGVYLIIIGIQDVRYRDEYHINSLDWVASWGCTFIGIMAMVSSEVSLLILTFISVERFLLIAGPFGGRRRLTSHNVFLCLFTIWLVGISIAVIPGKKKIRFVFYLYECRRFYFSFVHSNSLAYINTLLWSLFGYMFSASFTRAFSNWMGIFGRYFYGF